MIPAFPLFILILAQLVFADQHIHQSIHRRSSALGTRHHRARTGVLSGGAARLAVRDDSIAGIVDLVQNVADEVPDVGAPSPGLLPVVTNNTDSGNQSSSSTSDSSTTSDTKTSTSSDDSKTTSTDTAPTGSSSDPPASNTATSTSTTTQAASSDPVPSSPASSSDAPKSTTSKDTTTSTTDSTTSTPSTSSPSTSTTTDPLGSALGGLTSLIELPTSSTQLPLTSTNPLSNPTLSSITVSFPDPTDTITLTSGLPTSVPEVTTNTAITDIPTTPTDSFSATPTATDLPPTSDRTDTTATSDAGPTDSGFSTAASTGTSSPTDSAPPPSSTSFTDTSSPTSTDSGTPTATDSGTPTSTGTDSTTSPGIATQFSFLTASSLVFTSIPTTTVSPTLSDPDQAPTTVSIDGISATASPTAPALPNNLSQMIFPANGIDPSTAGSSLDGFSLASLLFKPELGWIFVAQNTETTNQLFAYTPLLIAQALGVDPSEIIPYALKAYTEAAYAQTGDPSDILTVFLFYMPTNQTQALAAQLLAINSPLYDQSSGVPHQIAGFIEGTFNLLSYAGPSGTGLGNVGGSQDSNSSSTTSGPSQKMKDAVIGIGSGVAGVILCLAIWWGVRTHQRNKERQHRRLSDPIGGGNIDPSARHTGLAYPTMAYGAGGGFEEHMQERRRSFYFAEDSLRGYAAPRPEDQDDEIYVHHRSSPTIMQQRYQSLVRGNSGGRSGRYSPDHRRAPIVPSAISAPILRESSLNW